jgi:hypothetical protein
VDTTSVYRMTQTSLRVSEGPTLCVGPSDTSTPSDETKLYIKGLCECEVSNFPTPQYLVQNESVRSQLIALILPNSHLYLNIPSTSEDRALIDIREFAAGFFLIETDPALPHRYTPEKDILPLCTLPSSLAHARRGTLIV